MISPLPSSGCNLHEV